jgi:hypothetical protein
MEIGLPEGRDEHGIPNAHDAQGVSKATARRLHTPAPMDCCGFIADTVIILSLKSLLFRRCSAAVMPLLARCFAPLFRPRNQHKTKQSQ